MEIRQLIKEYLNDARLMQVATSKDNQPWACSVYFAFDDEFNLFWISLPSTRHSQELKANQKVAGTIVLPHTPGDAVRGIQFDGVAKELTTGEEFHHALELYAKRMNMKEERRQKIADGKDEHNVYMIKPTLFVLFDSLNFPINPRQELHIQS